MRRRWLATHAASRPAVPAHFRWLRQRKLREYMDTAFAEVADYLDRAEASVVADEQA